MTLFPVRNASGFDRDYYKDTKSKQLYCTEYGTWYFCGSSTEPNCSLTPEEVEAITIE